MHSYAIVCKLVRIAKGNVAERAALLASGALARFWVWDLQPLNHIFYLS